MRTPKFSILTITFNNEKHIEKTINSVLSQSYQDYEYIIIDGNSTDNTNNIIKSYERHLSIYISEDDEGIYDALNKGISYCRGEFIILLHSGDWFINNHILSEINNHTKEDLIYLFSVYYSNGSKIVRKYNIDNWKIKDFSIGLMPPHLGFVAPSKFYQRTKPFRTDFSIAADYELVYRMLVKERYNYKKIPIAITVMLMGGESTKGLRSIIKIHREIKMIMTGEGKSYNFSHFLKKMLKRIQEIRV